MVRLPFTLRATPLLRIVAAALLLATISSRTAVAQRYAAATDSVLLRLLKDAPVTLERGLSAASSRGTPISAKYEVEDGKLQLSVYTVQKGRFWEVIVDHHTGQVTKSEEITSGDDLKRAKLQSDAISKAKQSLAAAVTAALKENTGFTAVSVIPAVKAGHATANVTVVKGASARLVARPLD